MTYTAEKPKLALPSEVLRQQISGWGVDLDPKDRPGVPKERFNPGGTGAHWTFPERQIQKWDREKSTEHKFVTPVFGTACPPKGLSGVIRKSAYRYSEGRVSHWLLLMLADRVDVLESSVSALLRGKPDNPLTERGLQAEFRRGGIRSRFGQKRADLVHQPVDVLLMLGTGLAAGALAYGLFRGLKRARAF